jgi:hypothetical protein
MLLPSLDIGAIFETAIMQMPLAFAYISLPLKTITTAGAVRSDRLRSRL